MAPTTSSTTVNGFTVLPVSYSSSSTHYIYARPHIASKKPEAASTSKSRKNGAGTDLPSGRTLFLVNVPPDATERELVLLFKPCGTVEKVVFDFEVQDQNADSDSDSEEEEDEQGNGANVGGQDGDDDDAMDENAPSRRRRKQAAKEQVPKVVPLPQTPHRTIRKTGLTAYVVFLDESAMDRVSSLSSKTRPWPISSEEPSGLAHYAAVYRSLRPPMDAIREHVDSYMELFEYKLAKTKQKSKYRKGEAVVDEDGFTLVTRGGAYGKTLGGGVAVASKRFQRSGESARHRPKKEKAEKEGFYAFQRAEKQRSELFNLKKRWEEDKAKVEKLKQSRKFKPY